MLFSVLTLESLIDASGFVPRAVCGSWTEGEVLLNNAADLAVALAYLVIPFVLTRLQRRRPDLPFSWILVVFGLFIVTCGATHLMEIVLSYHPVYRLAGLIKVLTALASWAAVIALMKISPALLALRSPQELEALNAELALEVEQRRKAEDEKEVLLRELHHRVKNNLQMVSSLLQLQENSSTPEDRTVLKESRNRVRTLALVHESIYQSSDLALVDMDNYLKRVCRALGESAAPLHRIEVEANARFDSSVAVPIGLIVNELVTNSIKHGKKGGSIRVTLGEDNGQMVLRVQDDGPGYPEPSNCEATVTLGLRLVNALAGQLGGEIRFQNDDGAVATIVLPSS